MTEAKAATHAAKMLDGVYLRDDGVSVAHVGAADWREVFDARGAPSGAIATWMLAAKYATWSTGMDLRVSNETLARKLGRSRQTVNEHMGMGRDLGWFTVVERPPGGPIHYRLSVSLEALREYLAHLGITEDAPALDDAPSIASGEPSAEDVGDAPAPPEGLPSEEERIATLMEEAPDEVALRRVWVENKRACGESDYLKSAYSRSSQRLKSDTPA